MWSPAYDRMSSSTSNSTMKNQLSTSKSSKSSESFHMLARFEFMVLNPSFFPNKHTTRASFHGVHISLITDMSVEIFDIKWFSFTNSTVIFPCLNKSSHVLGGDAIAPQKIISERHLLLLYFLVWWFCPATISFPVWEREPHCFNLYPTPIESHSELWWQKDSKFHCF